MSPENVLKKGKMKLIKYAGLCVLFLFIIASVALDTSLFSIRHLRNVLSNTVPLLLLSTAVGISMFYKHINFAVGAIASFSGILAGIFLQDDENPYRLFKFLPSFPTALIVPLIVAFFFVLGMLFTLPKKIKILPPWLSSLILSVILTSISYMIVYNPANGTSYNIGFKKSFLFLGSAYIGIGPTYSIPISLIIVLVIYIGIGMVLKKNNLSFKQTQTKLAENQGNYQMDSATIMIGSGMVFALSAFSGILAAAHLGTTSLNIFIHTENSFIICFLASFSLFGFTGSYVAILIASIIYAAVFYCWDFFTLNPYILHVLYACFAFFVIIKNIQRRDNEL